MRRALLLLLLLSCSTPSAAPPRRVVILHTNDIHGQAYAREDRATKQMTGGLAALAHTIRRIRSEERAKGATVLVVDCGDFFQGTPEGNLTKGRLIVDYMNAVGYDALCVGNHDFDFGPAVTRALAERARFPFLGANVFLKGSRDPPPWLSTSVDFPGLQLELLGLLTSDMLNVTMEHARVGLDFEREEEALARLGWTKPAAGRVRVLLTHVGIERERQLIAAGKFDVLCGGHSHTALAETIGATTYVQSGSRTSHVGRVDLLLADGRVLEAKSSLVVPLVSGGEDADIAAIIRKYAADIDRVMDEVVGELSQDLPHDAPMRSSPLGSYLCDVMRDATGAEVALHNRTGIRSALSKGVVKRRDIFQVSPFGNTLFTMKLKGTDLRELLDRMLTEKRFLLEASGLDLVHDAGKIVSLEVAGKPLDPDRLYTIVTNSFLAPGGDGHQAFLKGVDRRDTGIDLMDANLADLKKSSPRVYAASERIRPK
jgi:2',3'-cyclic-nucleotide 2'-phosphodiesterase (5'-nucleotidase family)